MLMLMSMLMAWHGFDNERIALRLSTEVLAAKPKEKEGKKHLVLAKKKKKTKMIFSSSLKKKSKDDLYVRDALRVKSKRLTNVFAPIEQLAMNGMSRNPDGSHSKAFEFYGQKQKEEDHDEKIG